MRKAVSALVLSTVLPVLVLVACKKNDEQQPPPQQPYGQQPYGQPTGYGTAPAPTGYGTAPAPTGYGTAPTATGTMSQPSPMAFPCQSDAQCLSHRCNTQYGKCAWPCQSNNDCQPGFQCVTPACIPAVGGQQQPTQ